MNWSTSIQASRAGLSKCGAPLSSVFRNIWGASRHNDKNRLFGRARPRQDLSSKDFKGPNKST